MANVVFTFYTVPFTASELEHVADLFDHMEGDQAEAIISSHILISAPDHGAMARDAMITTDHVFSLTTEGVSCIHCGVEYVRGMRPVCPAKG